MERSRLCSDCAALQEGPTHVLEGGDMGGAGMEHGDWGRMEWKVETGDMEWNGT